MTTTGIPHRSTHQLGAANQNWKLSFFGVLRSEWMKFWSLRSSKIIVPIAYILAVLPPILFILDVQPKNVTPEAIQMYFNASGLLPLIVVAFCVTTVTTEWGTGSIYSAVTAVPQRTPLFFAKIIITSLITAVLSFLVSMTVFATVAYTAGSADIFRDPQMWLVALLKLVGVLFTAILASFVAFLLRNTAGAIVLIYSFLLVVQTVLTFLTLRFEWMGHILKVMPSVLTDSIMGFIASSTPGGPPTLINSVLSPSWSLVAMGVWIVVLGFAAWFTFKRRDI